MNEPTMSSWTIDPGHSAIQFKVKHLAIASVWGSFSGFSGRVQTERDDFGDAQVHLEIDSDSVSTNNEVRDTHLKSDAFLDVAHFPTLSFRGMLQKTAESYGLTGELSLHGVTKQVSLQTTFMGLGPGRWGETRAGFELSGQLNRTDFGLSWKMLTEVGSLIVGEIIELQIAIELLKE